MTAPMPMTPARRALLMIGVPVALVIIGAAAFNAVALADEVTYHVHRSFDVSSGRVNVSIQNADATFRPGPGRRVWVSGTLRGSLARPGFRWQPTASSLALDSWCRVPGAGNCSASYTITAPGGLPVHLSDSSGDLTASGFRGRVALSDGSGDLGASRLSGVVSLADGSGDIDASGLTGSEVRFADGSGDITTSGLADGTVSVTDGSGDIDISGLAGTDVVAKDTSGDIAITFTKVPRRVDITDGSGDITLVLPRGPVRYEVQAASSSGDTAVSVPRSISSPYVITASDRSGDISIS